MPLSEKAKGKRKATEDSLKVPPSPPPELIIRFTEGVQDLKITVDLSQSVGNVKNLVSTCFQPQVYLILAVARI